MDGTCIIGNSSWEEFARQCGATLVPFPALGAGVRDALRSQDRQIEVDCKIHDWLHRIPANPTSPLILDLDEDTAIGLLIALHVRLSLESLGLSALRPLVLVSECTLEMLLADHPYAQIIAAKGCYLCQASDLSSLIKFFKPISVEQYQEEFLSRVNIKAPAEIGRHSLANLWGAGVMYRLTHEGDMYPDGFGFLSIVNKILYLKYIRAITEDVLNLVFKNRIVRFAGVERINASGKKILYLDDAAKAGWDETLRDFLSHAESVDVIDRQVGSFDDYSEDEKNLILDGDYDLILLDLRLGGLAEESVLSPDALSGMDVLRTIKNENRGAQVIIFTASNKAWNFKTLTGPTGGANGYYIKESPDSRFTSQFSVANLKSFRREVVNCFNNGYLRDFFRFKEDIRRQAEVGDGGVAASFRKELASQLEIAYNMAENAGTPETFQYAFLATYQAVEMITSYFGDMILVMMEMKRGSIVYEFNGSPVEDAQWVRIGNILTRRCGRKDDGLIHLTRQIIKLRNDFIHKDMRFGTAAPMNLEQFYMHPEAQDQKLLYAEPSVFKVMESMASKGMLFILQRHITMNRQTINGKEGIEITLLALKRIYEAINPEL